MASGQSVPLTPAVAPHAGARIETSLAEQNIRFAATSPLMQGRGSKPSCAHRHIAGRPVAPHAGARIETSVGYGERRWPQSPLMQGRGSKHCPLYCPGPQFRRPSCRGADRNTHA